MAWAAQITSLDILFLLIFTLLLARGIWIGFFRQLAFVVAMFSGFAIAGQYHAMFFQFIEPVISSSRIAFLFSYVILFALIYLLVILLGKGLQKVMNITMLVWFDRLMGGLFGLAKALFINSLIFMVLAGFLSGSNSLLRKSYSYPFMSKCSEIVLTLIKDGDLRSMFLLKEPAIFLPKEPAIKPEEKPAEETDGNLEDETTVVGEQPAEPKPGTRL